MHLVGVEKFYEESVCLDSFCCIEMVCPCGKTAMTALCRVSGGRFACFRRPDINSCRSKSNLPMLFVRSPILLSSTVADSQLDASRLIRYQENNHSAKKKAPIIKKGHRIRFSHGTLPGDCRPSVHVHHSFTARLIVVKRGFWNFKNIKTCFLSIKQ